VKRLISDGKGIGYTTGQGGMKDDRKTLVFVHGSGGSHLQWNYQRLFFQKSYNVVMVDLPGHGEAGNSGEDSVGAYTKHLLHLVRSLPGDKFCLLGHSLGGAIVQTFALLYPRDLEALILVGTGSRLRVLPEILTNIREKFEETVRLIHEYAFSEKAPRDLIERGIEAMLRTRPDVLHGDLIACNRFDIMDRVESIQIPALVICGRDDRLTPPKYAYHLADRIQGARVELIDDAGHMVMIEKPEPFNRALKEFLQTLNAKPEGGSAISRSQSVS
jgi:pimeloyl-ACP methyl ester carboxylesterase